MKREQRIKRCIELAYDSLQSHLPHTYPHGKKHRKAMRMNSETHAFHKKCVREYAEIINHLSKLL